MSGRGRGDLLRGDFPGWQGTAGHHGGMGERVARAVGGLLPAGAMRMRRGSGAGNRARFHGIRLGYGKRGDNCDGSGFSRCRWRVVFCGVPD